MPSIISDSSCLIIFDKIEGFEILHSVYKQIYTTPEVAKEFRNELPGWIIIETVKDKKYQRFIESLVDGGEASAIALASEKEDVLLLLDDLKARKLTKRLGVKFTGTLGILNKAKEQGIILKIKPVIEKLKDADFRISESVIQDLLIRNKE